MSHEVETATKIGFAIGVLEGCKIGLDGDRPKASIDRAIAGLRDVLKERPDTQVSEDAFLKGFVEKYGPLAEIARLIEQNVVCVNGQQSIEHSGVLAIKAALRRAWTEKAGIT